MLNSDIHNVWMCCTDDVYTENQMKDKNKLTCHTVMKNSRKWIVWTSKSHKMLSIYDE